MFAIEFDNSPSFSSNTFNKQLFSDLCWGGGERHEGQILSLLGKVSVGHGEPEDLRQIGQLLLRRHSLTYRQWGIMMIAHGLYSVFYLKSGAGADGEAGRESYWRLIS